MMLDVQLQDEADTATFGRLLATHLPEQCVVALDGTLGAGKTRLTQAIAVACGVPVESVTSPTFSLWQTYQGSRTIHHLDAYRIGDEDEFDALGVEECFDEPALTIIEWASRVKNCLPTEGVLWIEMEVVGDQQRSVQVRGESFDALESAVRDSGLLENP